MTYTVKQIAKMIVANVDAYYADRITREQFDRVSRATWELADRGKPCVIGSATSWRVIAVQRQLRAMDRTPG